MANYNKVILLGNLTRDPQLRYLPSQMAVVDIGLAVNHRYKTAQGEDREEVCFIDCSAFGKQAGRPDCPPRAQRSVSKPGFSRGYPRLPGEAAAPLALSGGAGTMRSREEIARPLGPAGGTACPTTAKAGGVSWWRRRCRMRSADTLPKILGDNFRGYWLLWWICFTFGRGAVSMVATPPKQRITLC